MTKDSTKKSSLSEEEVDNIIESQADDDEAWDTPIEVSGKQYASLSIPLNLATRAAFLAKLHKERDVEEWLRRVIKERIELEESAFIEFKRVFASKRRA